MNPSKNRHIVAAMLALALLAGCFSNSSEKSFEAARKALSKGDRGAAVIELKNALQRNPKMGEARLLLAQVLYDSGNFSDAEIELTKASEAGYVSDKIIVLRAKLMLVRGRRDKVLSEFAQTKLEHADDMGDLQASLALATAQLGRVPEALSKIEEALKLAPENVRAHVIHVRLLANLSRIDDALKEVTRLVGKYRQDAEVWRAYGDLLVTTGKNDEAISAYQQSSKFDKQNIAARTAAFALHMQKKDFVGAEKELNGLRQYAGQYPLTATFIAALALERNQLNEAREAIYRALKGNPNEMRALLLAGQIELRRGALLEADAHLNKVIAALPDNVPARVLLAQTRLRQGDPARALTTLQPVLIDDGKHLDAMGVAADAYMQAGDVKKAETYFAMLAKANPKDVRSRVALALAAVRQGRYEQGVAELRALAASDSGTTSDLALINLQIQKKDFVQALVDIDQLQRKDAKDPISLQLRGQVELARGKTAQAREAFDAALKVDGSYIPAVSALADLDMAVADFAAATSRFQSLVARLPGSLPANMGLLAVRAKGGAKYPELVDMLTKLVDRMPSEAAPRLALIDTYLRNKETKLALAAAQGAAATIPNNSDIQSALGRAQARAGDFDQSVAALNKQIALNPNSPAAYMTLAELYANRKDRPLSTKILNRALGLKADFLPAQAALISLATAGGDFAEARKIAETIKRQRPKEAAGDALMGDVEYSQKRWEAAATAYRAALGIAASPDLAVKLHQTYARAGNTATTKAFEAEWLTANPDDLRFLMHLGDRALVQQDYAAAEGRYTSVLAAQPENVLALNNMAWLLLQSNRADAMQYALKANQLAPDSPAFMDTLAQIHAKATRFDKATEIQKKVVSLVPNNPSYRLNLARYYIAQGQKDSARQELNRLAGLGDKLPQQQEAKKLLATL